MQPNTNLQSLTNRQSSLIKNSSPVVISVIDNESMVVMIQSNLGITLSISVEFHHEH